jgi:hypothetical protein
VFTYDGLLIAAEQFAYTRDTFLVGTGCLFLPAILVASLGPKSMGCQRLLAVWGAKALLNWWRAGAAVGRISFWLPRYEWQLSTGGGGGKVENKEDVVMAAGPINGRRRSNSDGRGGARPPTQAPSVDSSSLQAPLLVGGQ